MVNSECINHMKCGFSANSRNLGPKTSKIEREIGEDWIYVILSESKQKHVRNVIRVTLFILYNFCIQWNIKYLVEHLFTSSHHRTKTIHHAEESSRRTMTLVGTSTRCERIVEHPGPHLHNSCVGIVYTVGSLRPPPSCKHVICITKFTRHNVSLSTFIVTEAEDESFDTK